MRTSDAAVKEIGLKAFPDYAGRSFGVQVYEKPLDCCSYWDGGSRNYWRFVRLSDSQTSPEIPQQSAFDKPVAVDAIELPEGYVAVKHAFFCGRDCGLTIYARPENIMPYLPAPIELSLDEKQILYCISAYKSSYSGISNYRYHAYREHGGKLSVEMFSGMKIRLAAKGLLNRRGAVTNAGHNAEANCWPS